MLEEIHLYALIAFIFGAAIGSFINTISYRMPLNMSIFSGSSFCPHCKKTLKMRHMLPIFSYLMQKGRCIFCHKKIHIRYLAVEIITALNCALLVLNYNLTPMLIVMLILSLSLITMIVIDFEHYILPDKFQIILLINAFFYIYIKDYYLIPQTLNAIALLSLSLILKYSFWRLAKKDALGWGDVKFFFIAGLYLQPDFLPIFLLLSGSFGVITAIIWKKLYGNEVFPFGPALAISLYLCSIIS
jgi:leader peptidase (prepilin peptidase) / N-methyltransferase